MLFKSALVAYSIFSMGWTFSRLLKRKYDKSLHLSEEFQIALTFGTALLIIPLAIIGIQPHGQITVQIMAIKFAILTFKSYNYLYFALSLALGIWHLNTFIHWVLKQFENFDGELIIKNLRQHAIVLLIILLFMEYFILVFLLPPERGWDALFYYFPQGKVFYLTDSIPKFDFLSLRPTEKAPLIILFISYSLYVTKAANLQFIPLLYLVGLQLLVFDFLRSVGYKEKLAQLGLAIVLVTPFVYWLIDQWLYYQDLYVGYYYSLTAYWLWKIYITKETENPQKIFLWSFYGAMAFSLALLSKISAWTLPAVLIIAYPTKKPLKPLKILFLSGLAVFLALHASTSMYIGVGILILVIAASMVYLIIRQENVISWKQNLTLGVTLLGGMFFGGFWLYRVITQFPNASDFLIKLYFTLESHLQWHYPIHAENMPASSFGIEHLHSVSFLGGSMLLIGSLTFGVLWFYPKLVSLFYNHIKMSFFLLWIGGFYIIWSSYYFTVSIRYLTPILVPLLVIVADGILTALKKFTNDVNKKFYTITLLTALFGVFNYYYIPPLSTLLKPNFNRYQIALSYLKAGVQYYRDPLMMILLMVTSLVTYHTLLRKDLFQKMTHVMKNTRFLSFKPTKKPIVIVYGIFIFLIIAIPIAVPMTTFAMASFDINKFRQIYDVQQSESYKELIEKLNSEATINEITLSFNTPGIQYFSERPYLEAMGTLGLFNATPLFESSHHINAYLDFFSNPFKFLDQKTVNSLGIDTSILSIKFIIIPRPSFYWYPNFESQWYLKTPFFRALDNNKMFTRILTTTEFILYKVNTKTFNGLIDLSVTKNARDISLLGPIEYSIALDKKDTLTLWLDYPQFENYTTSVHLLANITFIDTFNQPNFFIYNTTFQSIEFTQPQSFTLGTLLPLFNKKPQNITKIELTTEIFNQSTTEKLYSQLYTLIPLESTIYLTSLDNNVFYLTTQEGFQIS